MSTLTMPWTKAAPKHRAVDEVQRLRDENANLKAEREEFSCHFAELGRTHLLTRDLLDQAGIDLTTAQEDARAANERADEAERLRDEEHAELVELRARVMNLDPWSVPTIGVRDDPNEQNTEPIDVRTLRAEHAEPWRSPVVHLNQAPFARRPTPADVDPRSLSARFMAGETRVTVNGGPFAKASA
jgi:hypothetical protein